METHDGNQTICREWKYFTRFSGGFFVIVGVLIWTLYMYISLYREQPKQLNTIKGQQLVYTMKDRVDSQNGHLPKVGDEAEEITNMQSMKNHLEQSCQVLREKHMIPYENRSRTPLTADLPERVMISEDFRLIGCKLLKVGSTNIRRLLYTLDNLSTLNDTNESNKKESRNWHIDIRFLKGKKLSEMREKLKTYTTFMFVRDPIERLMSAYRDNKPHVWLQRKRLSFYKFLMAIVKTPTRELNRHLKLYSLWCQPCSVTYDFIGRLNNFDEDMETILESVGANDLAILPKRNQTGYSNVKSSNVVEKFRRDIPIEIRKQIYEKYYIDYYLFGFPRPY